MYELRTELDRNGQTRLSMRPDAPANVQTRVEQQRRAAGTGELGRRGETGSTGAYDQNIIRSYGHLLYSSRPRHVSTHLIRCTRDEMRFDVRAAIYADVVSKRKNCNVD